MSSCPCCADGRHPAHDERHGPPGPFSKLHLAASDGSTERTVTLLSSGSDVDKFGPGGATPLMFASNKGYSRVVRILLNKGANASAVDESGNTALHLSAKEGHLAVSKMLVAVSDLDAATVAGDTPLHLAAKRGQPNVMSALIEAGANPDSRREDGKTPLCVAAQHGMVDAVKVLLRANADPLLVYFSDHHIIPDALSVVTCPIALDVAAIYGHTEVVRVLLQQVGIEGCGGVSGGIDALGFAAKTQNLDIMAMLMDAGVVDKVSASIFRAGGNVASVKFLLQRHEGETRGGAIYANGWNRTGMTPLIFVVGLSKFISRFPVFPSPKIVRLLVDAGADTTSVVRVTNETDEQYFHDTPLALTIECLHGKKTADGEEATEQQLHGLEGIRRLLLRVDAVHAVSWLWPSDSRSVAHDVTEGTSPPVASMLPILKRRARTPSVLLAALSRYSSKP